MKLSDKLGDQITVLKCKIDDLETKLKDQTQCKEGHRAESERLKVTVHDLQVKLQLSQGHIDDMLQQLGQAALHATRVEFELSEYKEHYKSTEAKFSALKEEHNKVLGKLESAEYSKLLVSQDLELLKAQFEMIAHNIQELHKLMGDVDQFRFKGDKLFIERRLLSMDFERQKVMTDHLSSEYDRIYTLRKAEQMSLAMLDGAFADMSGQREKAIKYLVKKNEKLVKCMDSTAKENADLRDRVKEMTKKYESLSNEFRRLWKKHTSIRNQETKKYERCKRCDKMYIEDDNFNWSCRIHTSNFNSFWLCCGKKERQANGCSTSRHLPLDEIEKLGLGFEAAIVTRDMCGHCKVFGHSIKNCPKDPNRIFSLQQTMTEKVTRSVNLTADTLRLIRAKLGDVEMTKEDMSSPSNTSQSSDYDSAVYDECEVDIREKLKDTMKIRKSISSIAMRRASQSYSLNIIDTTGGTELAPVELSEQTLSLIEEPP
eukprot:CAMPEP_0204901626 /NCGR_PEP_ID=MMETSP1397-20131031/3184_1 /ASSEMBLY_ACC=CAM_ASM_000891 /TAXON_ID=49980 /ORGANISM="Climacostomum Climacostomum virens, Strain Stock W-24" /LENGTH=485 /DNA_ID=CAMNT_0052070007 /DNA_START=376 /DNA_END=1829 /DNA_ORIENTATION=-